MSRPPWAEPGHTHDASVQVAPTMGVPRLHPPWADPGHTHTGPWSHPPRAEPRHTHLGRVKVLILLGTILVVAKMRHIFTPQNPEKGLEGSKGEYGGTSRANVGMYSGFCFGRFLWSQRDLSPYLRNGVAGEVGVGVRDAGP